MEDKFRGVNSNTDLMRLVFLFCRLTNKVVL